MKIIAGVQPYPAEPGSTLQHLVSFTPGRVNLIGEHTDYNGGMVMPAALELGIRSDLKILSSDEGQIFCASKSANETVNFTMDEVGQLAQLVLQSGLERSTPVSVPDVSGSHWTRYVLGCFALFEAFLQHRHIRTSAWSGKTLSFVLESTLPQGAGLSSSAALSISLLGQLNFLAGAPLDGESIARLAMLVEHKFAGTHCGLMDQLAVLCSRQDHFTRIDFLEFPVSKSFHISYAKAHEAFQNYTLLIFKTGVNHSLAESAYNDRRSSCETALRALNKALGLGAHSLGELARLPRFRDLGTETDYLKYIESLLEGSPEQATLARRATHAMLENSRVVAASQALNSGNLSSLHQAMRSSHQSLDCLYEVSCHELNVACQAMASVVDEFCAERASFNGPALIGPRMTGGGFGGSTVQLIHRSLTEHVLERFSNKDNPYTRATGLLPQLFVSRPSSGFSIGMETIV
jgi:galactokinase